MICVTNQNGDYERSPGIVKVLLKRLIGEFNLDGEHYDMMRQSSITQ